MDLVTLAMAAAMGGGGGGGSSGGGVLVVHVDENEVLDKTWQEIKESPFAVLKVEDEYRASWLAVSLARNYDGIYKVFIDEDTYTADSPDGYPVLDESGAEL